MPTFILTAISWITGQTKSFKFWLYAGLVLAFLGIIIYAYHEKHAYEDAEKLLTIKEVQIDQQNQTIAEMKMDITKIQIINTSLTAVNENISKSYETVSTKLQTLEKTAKTNPTLAQIQVNQEFKDRNRCFVLITGAKINSNEINSVCPNMVVHVK